MADDINVTVTETETINVQVTEAEAINVVLSGGVITSALGVTIDGGIWP